MFLYYVLHVIYCSYNYTSQNSTQTHISKQLQKSIQLAKSSAGHMSNDLSSVMGYAIRYRVPSHASLDGNTVDPDFEKSAFTENAIRYQFSLNRLSKKISGLIRTLKGE